MSNLPLDSTQLNDSEPLYAQVYRALRTKIIEGEFPPGANLPTEKELASRFGVSLITARRALGDLVHEGLIQRKSGKGTTVVPRLLGLSSLLEVQGRRTRTRILAVDNAPLTADSPLHVRMGVPVEPAVAMLRVRRLRYVDDRPAVVVDNYVDHTLSEHLGTQDLENASLYERIEELTGLPVTRIDVDMVPTVADADLSDLLQVAEGSAHYLWLTTSFLADRQPVLYGVGVYSSAVFRWKTALLTLRGDAYATQSSRWEILEPGSTTVEAADLFRTEAPSSGDPPNPI